MQLRCCDRCWLGAIERRARPELAVVSAARLPSAPTMSRSLRSISGPLSLRLGLLDVRNRSLTPPAALPSTSHGPNRQNSAAPLTPVLEPSRLVSVIDKLARVAHQPEPHWLDMYLAACQPILPMLSLSEIAVLVRSLARLDVEVPLHWAQALLEASSAALPSAEYPGDVCQLLLWVAEDGRLEPGAEWVGAALQQIHHLVLSGRPGAALSPGHAADVAWVVARLGFRPTDPLLDCLAAASIGRSPDGGGRPPPPGSSAGLSSLPPEQLARLAWAVASYNYFPPDEWVQAYWLEGIWVRGLSPEGAAAVMWSLGTLQLPLERLWVSNFALATAGRLSEIPPEGLINALWGLAACRQVDLAADARQQENGKGQEAQELPEDGAEAHLVQQQYDRVAAALAVQFAALTAADEDGRGDGGRISPAERQQRAALRAALERRLGQRGKDGSGMGGEESGTALVQRPSASPEVDAEKDKDVSDDKGNTASRATGDGPDGDGDGSDLLPTAWLAEWYDATLPYLGELDKPLVVKALWAAAALELRPPPEWLAGLLAAMRRLMTAGPADGSCMEPLELWYGSRSAEALLDSRRRRLRQQRQRQMEPQNRLAGAPAAAAREMGVRGGEEHGTLGGLAPREGEAEAVVYEELASFAAECFEVLCRQRLPPAWRRLNPMFPPYAQPKPGQEGEGGGQGNEGEASSGGARGDGGQEQRERRRRRSMMGPGLPDTGGLRPFR